MKKHRHDQPPSKFPPLSACTFVTILGIVYMSILFGNLVTLRQVALSETINIQPLPDTLILQNVKLPSFTDRLLLRDWVDAIAGVWCSFCFVVWLCARDKETYASFTTFLMAQTVVVPLFCVTQWMTAIPDSDPTCLDTIDLPEGSDWVWSRVSLNQCGDMLWSSAIAQSILFAFLAHNTFKNACAAYLWMAIATLSIGCIAVMAWVARYQYACDVLLTVFIVPTIITHPLVSRLGHAFFFMNWSKHFPRNPEEEAGLMDEDDDEEFGIEIPSD